MAAAIAPWFRLSLPSYGPRFKSQAAYLCFIQFIWLKLKLWLLLQREKDENKKEAEIDPIFKEKLLVLQNVARIYLAIKTFYTVEKR